MEMAEDHRCCSKPNKRVSPDLPDVIIQHIQSFLRSKEAARTIILSKSWLRAWSTRPFLDFHWFDFRRKYSDDALIKLIDTTLDSYVEQGLTILKLRITVETIQQRWLQLARQRQCNVIELDLYSYHQKWEPTIWREIFMTNSLQSLKVYATECELVLSHKDIMCRNLNILDLNYLDIDYVTFLTIMSYCPLIEKLRLFHCQVVNCSHSGGFVGGEFASLRTLTLGDTNIYDDQLQTILSKSPRLEDLNLNLIHCCNLVKPINLSSVSLKRVKIVIPSLQITRIDAPNLRRLEYSFYCYRTTPFPIVAPATKGEINVDIYYRDRDIDASWFHGLRDFLSEFAKSNVKCMFNYYKYIRRNFEELRATPLPHRHQVESLKFTLVTCLPLLYAFFTILHPKIVLLGRLDAMSNRESHTKLLKDLSYRGNLACCKEDQNKCWRHYIKNAKVYYEVDKEQKPLDMNGLETWSGELIALALDWEF